METTTETTFTTRDEAARTISEAHGDSVTSVACGLSIGQTFFVGLAKFEDNGAGMVRITRQSWSVTADEWSRKHRDFRTGDPRKGTARVLTLTDRGTCLVPVTVVA
jgi:hypothetical protein